MRNAIAPHHGLVLSQESALVRFRQTWIRAANQNRTLLFTIDIRRAKPRFVVQEPCSLFKTEPVELRNGEIEPSSGQAILLEGLNEPEQRHL